MAAVDIFPVMSTHPSLRSAGVIMVVGLAACGLLTAPPDPPAAPSGLVAAGQSPSSVLLTWSAPDMGGPVAWYEVEREVGSGGFEAAGTPDASTLTHTDEGLEADRDYRYRLRACNDGGCSGFTGSVLTRTFGVLQVSTSALPVASAGVEYTTSLRAIGAGERIEWSLVAGSLPDGLALEDTTGVISGTPAAEEEATFTVQATSIDGQTDQAELTLSVVTVPIVIQNLALPPVIVGGSYDVALRATGPETITWSLASGTLPDGLTLNAAGSITGTPTSPGSAAITIRGESGDESAEKAFTLVVVPNDESGFNVTMLPVRSVPTSVQPHVDSAVARWNRVITGDVQGVLIPAGTFPADVCAGFGEEVNGTTLDDIIILLDIRSIDGPGGTLAQAGPCAIRSSGSNVDIPAVGLVTLDQSDMVAMTGTDNLTATILHEIGHALGYGALWEYLGLVVGTGTNAPGFTGTAATSEYEDLGGNGDVPLETEGGAGTAEVHWSESAFGNEVMTGFAEEVGTPQPLSRVSIASMQDLGYAVDVEEADDFMLAGMARLAVPTGTRAFDVLYAGPVVFIHPGGSGRVDTLP